MGRGAFFLPGRTGTSPCSIRALARLGGRGCRSGPPGCRSGGGEHLQAVLPTGQHSSLSGAGAALLGERLGAAPLGARCMSVRSPRGERGAGVGSALGPEPHVRGGAAPARVVVKSAEPPLPPDEHRPFNRLRPAPHRGAAVGRRRWIGSTLPAETKAGGRIRGGFSVDATPRSV